METLGELFRETSIVNGPVVLYTIPLMKYYLLGEHHFINGLSSIAPDNYIWNIINRYAKAHPQQKISFAIEANALDVQLFTSTSHSPSPLKKAVQEYDDSNTSASTELALYGYLFTKHRETPNVNFVLVNIRRSPPLSILEAVYDVATFASLRRPPTVHGIEMNEYNLDVFNKARAFEKEFFKSVSSRPKCMAFFQSLIIPGFDYPEWFIIHLEIFNISKTINPLKALLSELKSHDPVWFKNIIGIVEHMFDKSVSNNTEYSAGMRSATAAGDSASAEDFLVAQRYHAFKTFWISVNSIFMDIYIMCLMHLKDAGEMFVVLAGHSHIQNIIRHLKVPGLICAHNAKGCIRPSDITTNCPIPLPNDDINLMKAFRESRREIKARRQEQDRRDRLNRRERNKNEKNIKGGRASDAPDAPETPRHALIRELTEDEIARCKWL